MGVDGSVLPRDQIDFENAVGGGMKITKEHIGKRAAKGGGQFVEVLAVTEQTVVGRFPSWGEEHTWANGDDWELYEEPKKPSERIAELLKSTCDREDSGIGCARKSHELLAVMAYLDEQAEKK